MAKNYMVVAVLVAVVVWAGASAVRSQPEQVLLRYGWVDGDELQYDLSVRGQGQLVFHSAAIAQGQGGETPLPIVMSMDTVYRQLVKAIDEEGNGTVEIHWEPMQISVDMMGQLMQATVDLEQGTIRFNGQEQALPGFSPQPGAEPPAMKISPRGKVLAITNLERLMPMMGTAGLGQVDPSQIVRASQAEFPEEPVAAGAEWEQLVALPLPTGEGQQAPQMRSAYVLKGFATINERPCAKISTRSHIQLQNMTVPGQPAVGIGGAAGFATQIDAMQMDINGDLYFDHEVGRLIRALMNITMNLNMNIVGAAAQQQQIPGIQCELRDFAMEVLMNLKE